MKTDYTRLIERLNMRNENGSLGEITEDDQLQAATAIEALLERLEKAEKDAERWAGLCKLVNDELASVTFYGRLETINTGLIVQDSGDLHDELAVAMGASK